MQLNADVFYLFTGDWPSTPGCWNMGMD